MEMRKTIEANNKTMHYEEYGNENGEIFISCQSVFLEDCYQKYLVEHGYHVYLLYADFPRTTPNGTLSDDEIFEGIAQDVYEFARAFNVQ